MKRRHFLSWFSFSTALTILSACGGTPSSSTAKSASSSSGTANQRADGFFEVGQLQDLENTGTLFFSSEDGKSIAVFQDENDSESLYALETICSHQNCNVNWVEGDRSFACPCHGSKFDAQGKVLAGPAEQPLKPYSVKLEAGKILVGTVS